MTHRIPKSRIMDADGRTGRFEEAVQKHAVELRAWDDHMIQVRAGRAQAYPSPTAHADVDAAVRREASQNGGPTSFIVDYEIVDDGPTPEQTLAAQKAKLFQNVHDIEQAEMAAILPHGKRRLRAIEHRDATRKPEKDRTAGDKRTISAHEATTQRLEAVERWGAEQHAAIEDLTPENVDAWTPAPMPGKPGV